MLCFRKIPVAKKFIDKKGGRRLYQDYPSKCFSHSVKKIRRGIFKCFTNFRAPKILCSRVCHDFLSKTFCLTVPRNFLWEAIRIVFHKVAGSETFIEKRGGGERECQVFRRKSIVLQYRNTWLTNLSMVQRTSVIDKFFG